MIVVDGLSRRFGEFYAVRDVSFRVTGGEIVGLLGANGAGKSTIMRMISTLLEPGQGSIRVNGIDTRQDPVAVRKILGYHTGETGLYERHTPRELLTLFGRLHGLPKDEAAAEAATLVDAFEMGSFAEKHCGGLSTGQRQRVSLARTLMGKPRVLLLDEPTSGLDIVSSRFIMSALRELADNDGVAVLYSTHLMAEVELLCDRIIVIHEGMLVAEGTQAALREQTRSDSLAAAFIKLIGAESAESEADSEPMERTEVGADHVSQEAQP